MDTCLNVLESHQGFLLVATLVVIVLLVWTQLYASGEVAKQVKKEQAAEYESKKKVNVHGVMGLVWTYCAMFFALAAVATLTFHVDLAKGFLVWSFLMTVANVLLALIQRFSLIWSSPECPEDSLVGKSATRKWWILAWVALLVGLGFISFYIVDVLGCCFLKVGIGLVILAFAVVFAFVICASIKRSKKKVEKRQEKKKG